MALHPDVYLEGSQFRLPISKHLRVGNLSADFQDGALRNICLDGSIVLQRIYSAVRDRNWGTVPAQLIIIDHKETSDYIHIVFQSIHKNETIDFVWTGTIDLLPNSLSFTMDGIANNDFQRNRIGFCVLHDSVVAGSPLFIEHTNGTTIQSTFPLLIEPHQPFLDILAIQHEPISGVRATVRMEGDTFEMEDQRNWTDASFKTYCTPLAVPFPVNIVTGTRIQQSISLTLEGDLRSHTDNLDTTLSPVVITRGTVSHLDNAPITPLIGAGLATSEMSQQQMRWLKALQLRQLRIDLDLESDLSDQFLQQAAQIDIPIVLAVWFSADKLAPQLSRLKALLDRTHLHIQRIIVLCRGEKVTRAKTFKEVATALKSIEHLELFAGTDAFFTELNRSRPQNDDWQENSNLLLVDGFNFTTNPQVHAFDTSSLIETMAVHRDLLATAHSFCVNKPISISPVTLKMRWNPNATGPSAPHSAEQLMPTTDPRQMSLFGAVWTLGTLKHMSENWVESITFYQTHGYEGLMLDGSSLPDQFPDITGVFPLYHVIRAACLLPGAHVILTHSSQPRSVEALLFSDDKCRVLLIANYTAQYQQVVLKGFADHYEVITLDLNSVENAIALPDQFWQDTKPTTFQDTSQLLLSPYCVIICTKGLTHE